MRPLPLLLAVLLLALAFVCVRMGLWQHGRWQERRAANATQAAALAASPVPLSRGAELATRVGRKVEAVGEYDSTRHVLLSRESARGEMGVQVLTPLRLAGGGEVLVDRGWIAADSAAAVHPSAFTMRGEQRVVALAQALPPHASNLPWVRLDSAAPERWSTMDVGGDSLSARLAGVDTRVMLHALPDAASAPLSRGMPAPFDERANLSYAVQWALFTLAALAGAAFVLTRRPRTGS
ncbi:MAG: SURF1 family protein [Candidatus Eisenbacteria bacterium]|nr:SURF1 family protein [Candidatus Eisenbacteria bacterium]